MVVGIIHHDWHELTSDSPNYQNAGQFCDRHATENFQKTWHENMKNLKKKTWFFKEKHAKIKWRS